MGGLANQTNNKWDSSTVNQTNIHDESFLTAEVVWHCRGGTLFQRPR